MEVSGAHCCQGDDDRHVGTGVDEEAPCEANGGDEDATEAGANHPGQIHEDRVETHRVREQFVANHLLDEGLSGRVVEEVDESRDEREAEDCEQGHVMRRHQDTEEERLDERSGLRGEQDGAFSRPIDDEAGP